MAHHIGFDEHVVGVWCCHQFVDDKLGGGAGHVRSKPTFETRTTAWYPRHQENPLMKICHLESGLVRTSYFCKLR